MSIGSFAQSTSYKDGTNCYCDSIIQKYGESGNLIYERPYVNDRQHGMEVYYHENGMIKWEIPHINGPREGTVKYYDTTGVLKLEEAWHNGSRHGKSIRYYDSGSIESVSIYYNHERDTAYYEWHYEDGSKVYVQDSGIFTETGYHSGIIVYTFILDEFNERGVERTYYDTGLKSSETNYIVTDYLNRVGLRQPIFFRRGIAHGESISWRRNGKLMMVENYRYGKLHGSQYYAFNDNGAPRWISYYYNGLETAFYWYGDDGILDVTSKWANTNYSPYQTENGDIRGHDNDGDGRVESVYVRGYYKKDGTYVRSHYRAKKTESK